MENQNIKVGFPGLGSAIKAAREKAGLSQGAVAEILDISGMTVLRWEADYRTIELSKLRQLEAVYQVGEFVPNPEAVIKAFCQHLKKRYWRDDLGWTTNVTERIDSIIEEK